MATWLRQSTAVDIPIGPFVDSTDGFTPETALSLTQAETRLKKNNGAWAQRSDTTTGTHEEEGWYELELDATDTDTLGILIVACYVSGALPVWREFMVVAANIFDSLVAGGDVLDVSATQFNGSAIIQSGGRPEVNTSHVAGAAVSTSSAQIGVNVINAAGTAWNSGAIGAATLATDTITNAKIAADAIGASEIADGAIDAATFAAGAINAAAIAADAIGASELAADAVTEIAAAISIPSAAVIADAVWDEDATAHQTTGTFGQAIGDPVADTNSIFKAVVTDAAAATVGLDVVAIQADTDNIQTRLPASLVSGRIDASVGAVANDAITAASLATDAGTEIGTAVWATTTRQLTALDEDITTLDLDAHIRTALGLGSANLDTQLSGIQSDTDNIQTRIPAALVSGRMDSSVGAMAAGTITAAAIATDAIDADALASDAVTEINSGGSAITGTSDSGSTTTMVDAARTEADTDYWKGSIIRFTSGNISGQSRLITGFNAATDTITFAPATTQAVSTQTYVILPQSRVDIEQFGGTTGTFASGRPEVNTSHIAGAAVSAASAQIGVNVVNFGGAAGTFSGGRPEVNASHAAGTAWNSGAITTGTFASGAINAAAIATDAIGAAELADGAITAATFAAGAIDATAIATNAIDADSLAADAGTEIGTAVWATAARSLTVLDEDSTTLDLDATIRAALGLASANLDTQLAAVQADTDNIQTRIPAALVSGRMDSSVGAMAAGTITAAAIATDAIDADALAADAVAEIGGGAVGITGTADSGTTTTMVDAARTEADTDYWKGAMIRFTTGNIAGQTRLITGFVPGTDTITFTPATTQAVSTQTYEILGNSRVDVEQFGGTTGTFASGRPEVNTSHIAGAAVSTASAQIGVNVVNAGGTAWASGALTSGVFASGAITASAIATDAIGAAELAADAVTEIAAAISIPSAATIAGAVWNEDATAHQTQGTFGQAIGDPVADTNTLFKAVVTDANLATVGLDTAAIQADTDNIQTRIPASLVSGRIDASVGAVATDAINAASLAADAGTEIGTAVWATTTRQLTALDEDITTLDLDAHIRTALGLASANLDTQIAAVQADTDNIQTRIPAALVSGRIDASVGAMAANTITAAAIATDAIDDDAIATGAIASTAFASGAITAAAIAADAIGASELAADAVTEIATAVAAPTAAVIADAVWDEDATAHQTQGTFGQAIGDPVADTNTLFKAVVTDAAAATVGLDIVAVQADTDNIQTRIPAALVSGRIDASVGAMAADSITAAAIATGAIDADALATDAGTELADAFLNRDMATGTDSGSSTVRTVRQALRFLRNKWDLDGTDLTVYKENDSTASWTGVVTNSPGTDPITGSDPAGP
jgi:hypothetical protein